MPRRALASGAQPCLYDASKAHLFKAPPGHKSLRDIAESVKFKGKPVVSANTLGQMAITHDPFVSGAFQSSGPGSKWIVPDSHADAIITRLRKMAKLRLAGYTVPLSSLSRETGIPIYRLRVRDLRQRDILGRFYVTERTRQKLLTEGEGAFPRARSMQFATKGYRHGAAGATPDTHSGWLTRSQIRSIKGSSKPSSFYERATRYKRKHGRLPNWARRVPGRLLLIDAKFVLSEVHRNQAYISSVEAARLLGTSRRTILNWVNAGVLKEGPRDSSGNRPILRSDLLEKVPDLKKRLQRPETILIKATHGHRIPERVLASARAKIAERREETQFKKKLSRDEKIARSRIPRLRTEIAALREELNCSRTGLEYKGAESRQEEVIIAELNARQTELNLILPPTFAEKSSFTKQTSHALSR